VLLGKKGMLVLDAYKGHLTLEIEAIVTCCWTQTVLPYVMDYLTTASVRCDKQTIRRKPKVFI
jgi:hypothetical protein